MAPGVLQSDFTRTRSPNRVDPNALASTVLDDLWVIFEAIPLHRAIWVPIWGPGSFFRTICIIIRMLLGFSGGRGIHFYAVATCAYRKSSSSILVMQSTQDRPAQNASRCLSGT